LSGPAQPAPGRRAAWPGGLRARMLLLAVASLTLLHLGSIWIYDAQLREAATTSRETLIADRLAAAKRAVTALDPAERDATSHALAAPAMDLHWSPVPALGQTQPLVDARMSELRARLVAAAPELGDIRLAPGDEGAMGRLGHVVLGSLELPDGTWLNFSASLFRPLAFLSHIGRAPFASTTVMAMGVIIVTLLVATSLIRPLRRVAAAADEIGRTDRPVSVVEEGPDEVRQVAHAFNAMQARLLRMSADRALALAAVSHDLRTPLQRLRLRVSDLGDEEAQTRTEADLAEMEAMIDATLTYLRGTDDRPAEPIRPIDLASMLQSLCDDAADMGRDASFEGPERLLFRCRPIGLKRAVVNLVENALAYGERARVRLCEATDGTVSIEVEDDGPGIPESDLLHVFEPFWRRETSRNRATGGSGLGLTIARSAIEENGGTLELRNRPGGGLVAQARFPRAQSMVDGTPSRRAA